MRFEFGTASRILFGAGTVRELVPAAKEMGRRALVVTRRCSEPSAWLVKQLESTGVSCLPFTVAGEPTLDLVRSGLESARQGACDLVISFGGGSAIDAGKAIAALLTNPGEPLDYLEVVGRGQPLNHGPAPFIAVPTTAGTGSEVTRNAVLALPEHRVKVSLRSPLMLPRLAVVDPELTLGLPPAVTASTGLDALTQLIEPNVSVRANPLTDGFCREGLGRVSRSLRRAYHQGNDLEARTDMALASLLGGLALANAALGVVHGFAAPIGGMFPAPHGTVCAALLPHAMAINIRALRRRAPESEALRRYETVARVLTGEPHAGPEEGVRWVSELCHELGIAPLRSYGIDERDVTILVEGASRASSTKGNPIVLTTDELREILMASLHGNGPGRS
ncbi:MAG TPA: iron-containing alcohol dehydrogenase [Terriglobia bacterium]|nr:iron-containing alcohol dehydrogenase [Terriglobia bacterium]